MATKPPTSEGFPNRGIASWSRVFGLKMSQASFQQATSHKPYLEKTGWKIRVGIPRRGYIHQPLENVLLVRFWQTGGKFAVGSIMGIKWGGPSVVCMDTQDTTLVSRDHHSKSGLNKWEWNRQHPTTNSCKSAARNRPRWSSIAHHPGQPQTSGPPSSAWKSSSTHRPAGHRPSVPALELWRLRPQPAADTSSGAKEDLQKTSKNSSMGDLDGFQIHFYIK